MTAINVFLKSNEAHVFTDAAITDHDGKLIGTHEKTILFPSFPAALAMRGNSLSLSTISGILRSTCIVSFDRLLGVMEEVARVASNTLASYLKENAITTDFELQLVGWSEKRNCFENYFIPSYDVTCAGLGEIQAWRLNKAVDGCVSPMPLPEAIAAVGWKMPDSVAAFTKADGVKLMEAQRRGVYPQIAFKGSPSFFGVGGFVQHTIVTRQSVTSSVIHRWPDRVGTKIDPTGVEASSGERAA